MRTEIEDYYGNCRQAIGYWADRDVNVCGCAGRGWFLSELDTLHECPFHYDGQPTNEDSDEAWAAYYTKKARKQYKEIAQKTCRAYGLTPANFNQMARMHLKDGEDTWPMCWVDAAREVLEAHEEIRGRR